MDEKQPQHLTLAVVNEEMNRVRAMINPPPTMTEGTAQIKCRCGGAAVLAYYVAQAEMLELKCVLCKQTLVKVKMKQPQ